MPDNHATNSISADEFHHELDTIGCLITTAIGHAVLLTCRADSNVVGDLIRAKQHVDCCKARGMVIR